MKCGSKKKDQITITEGSQTDLTRIEAGYKKDQRSITYGPKKEELKKGESIITKYRLQLSVPETKDKKGMTMSELE